MTRGKSGIIVAALALVAVVAVTAGFTNAPKSRNAGTVYLAEISPLTGPLSFVGKDQREIIAADVNYINAHGGIKGRKLVVDAFDDGSNPSTGVVEFQKVASDPKYLGVLGSGFSSVSLAIQPLVVQAHIPYISLGAAAAQAYPPKPYFYMTTATTRLFAYAMAKYLRSKHITRIALMGDNGAFGREGTSNVDALANRFGFTITDRIIFPLTSTSFTAELSKVKDSNAQALWIWNATTLAVTIVKQARQLGLPQQLVLSGGNASPLFLGPACPEANGAYIDTYLGNVHSFLPKSNPSKALGNTVEKLIGHSASTFHYDGFTAVEMFKKAMQIGGFSRDGINNALERKMRGFVGPGGKYYYSPVNHAGLQVASMVVSRIGGCQLRALSGPALKPKSKKK